MAIKSTQPALYEKMRSRPGAAAPASQDVEPEAAAAPLTNLGSWLSPGRTIRIPVGYILLAVALLIIHTAIMYMIGNSNGKRAAKREFDQGYMAANSPDNTLRPKDPLTEQPAPMLELGHGTPPHGGATPNQGRGNAPNSAGTNTNLTKPNPPASWGPVVPKNDPRKKGMNYFILAMTNEPGAVKLAEFCRSSGLETYVVSCKNERFRHVIALPGFDLSVTKSTGPEINAFKERIFQIGQQWKTSKRGETNLSDAYLAQYDG